LTVFDAKGVFVCGYEIKVITLQPLLKSSLKTNTWLYLYYISVYFIFAFMSSFTGIKYFSLLKKKLKHEEGNLYPDQLAYLLLIYDYNRASPIVCRHNVIRRFTGNTLSIVKLTLSKLEALNYIHITKTPKNGHDKIQLTLKGIEKAKKYIDFYNALAEGRYCFETYKIKPSV